MSQEDVFDAIIRGEADELADIDLSWPDIRIEARGGQSLLHAAAAHGSLGVFRRVKDECWADYDEFGNTFIDDNGQTPLHIASRFGHLEVAEELVSLGADPMREDKQAMTPLAYAVENGADDAARFLLEKSGYVYSVLSNALRKGQSRLACWIIAETGGKDELFNAASHGDLKMCEFLIEQKVRVNNWDGDNWAPLHHAIWWGHGEKVARLLLDKGADPNDWAADRDAKGYWPISPLYMAIKKNKFEIAEALLDHGADPNDRAKGFTTLYQAPTGSRPTPLHLAAQLSNVALVDLLLKRGATHNTRDENGATPLHVAALQQDERIVLALMAAGAARNARNKDNDTPYTLARRAHHFRIAQLLRVGLTTRLRYDLGSAIRRLGTIFARSRRKRNEE